ncbi:MAG: DUF4352 domain-containing protein [Candidatus Saccharimonadales bacterium]
MKKSQETPIEKLEDTLQKEAHELQVEYKRFERFRNENSLLLSVFVLGIAALVIINTLFWVQVSRHRLTKEAKLTTTITSLKTMTSLQTAHNFAVTAFVANVGGSTTTDNAFPVRDDEILLLMDVTITNKTALSQQLTPVSQLYIRSVDGDYIKLHPSMQVKKPLEPQELGPGKVATGQLSFVIPKEMTSPLLYIDTGWDRSTPLVIDVLH